MYKQTSIETSSKFFNYKAILKGTLYSFYISMFLVIIMGLIMYFSNMSESWLSFTTSTIFVISVFIGGFGAAKIAGNKGLYHGLGVGLAFTLIAFLLTIMLIPGGFVGSIFLKKMLYSFFAGALGGIAGVAFN